MKCPHCLVEINPNFNEIFLGEDSIGQKGIQHMTCPNPDCNKMIIVLVTADFGFLDLKAIEKQIVYPFTSSRPPVPTQVNEFIAKDYHEACLICDLSPKASAALSRRCLQNILRDSAGVKKGNLENEIQQVLDSQKLPTPLADSIDAIRQIGNFAAHPIKSTSTGEIVDVEFGEAEWLLDVVESLFDYFYVQPATIKAKRDALNLKLADAGKKQMK